MDQVAVGVAQRRVDVAQVRKLIGTQAVVGPIERRTAKQQVEVDLAPRRIFQDVVLNAILQVACTNNGAMDDGVKALRDVPRRILV